MEEKEEVKIESKEKNVVEIKFGLSFLFMLFAITALALFVLVKICAHFGAVVPVFYGIMSIFIYCLPFVGMVLSYLFSKKLSPEFWANLGVLALTLAFM